MKKRFGYVKPWRSRTTRLKIAGASRYITHLTVLSITVIAVILATANMPQAQSSPPDIPATTSLTLPIKRNTTSLQIPLIVDASGAGGAADDSSIVRSFAPISATKTGESNGSVTPSSRGLFTYTVQSGDTLFGIASAFGLAPETGDVQKTMEAIPVPTESTDAAAAPKPQTQTTEGTG